MKDFFVVKQSGIPREKNFTKVCTKVGLKVSSSGNLGFLSAYSKSELKALSTATYLRGIPNLKIMTAKINLCRTLNAHKKTSLKKWSFVPRSWIYPLDSLDLRQEMRSGKRTFIVKSGTRSKGSGIYLVNKFSQIERSQEWVVQEYLRPCLFNGFKFDLRLYVFIYQYDFFLYSQGLVRMCTKPYTAPKRFPVETTDTLLSQLTNFSLNSKSDAFTEESKQTLEGLWEYLRAQGEDPDVIWRQIKENLARTFQVYEEKLKRNHRALLPQDPDFRMCFDVVGVDIMLDSKCKPYLLEINRYPSMKMSTPSDSVKVDLVRDLLSIMQHGYGNVTTNFQKLN